MHIFAFLFALLIAAPAWAQLVPVTLSCPIDFTTLHWTYVCGEATGSCQQLGDAFPEDCEWNGVNDAGEGDTDESDPTDPRWHWDYKLDGNISYAETFVQDTGAMGEYSIEALTIMYSEWQEQSGLTYAVNIALEGDIEDHFTALRITCDGQAEIAWDSSTGAPHPQWVAPSSGRCVMQHVSSVKQFEDTPPLGQQFGEDNVTVWRNQSGGGGCGMGPELAVLLPFLRVLRRRKGD